MPSDRGRRPPRRIRLEIHALPDIRLPHGRWTKKPAEVRSWYHALYPTERIFPEHRRPARTLPTSDMLVDMIRGGDVKVRRFESAGRVAMALTPKGKNTILLNRFLSSQDAFNRLTAERKEMLVRALVKSVIYAMDWNPTAQRFEPEQAIRQTEVVRQLRGDVNLHSTDQFLMQKYGTDHQKWPDLVYRYYLMQAKRGVLADAAVHWLAKKENWKIILAARANGTLWEGF